MNRMTNTQLKALIGCTLKYKSYEAYIIDIVDNTIYLNQNQKISIEDFIQDFYPNWKLYLTECDSSLVSIENYLYYYGIK